MPSPNDSVTSRLGTPVSAARARGRPISSRNGSPTATVPAPRRSVLRWMDLLMKTSGGGGRAAGRGERAKQLAAGDRPHHVLKPSTGLLLGQVHGVGKVFLEGGAGSPGRKRDEVLG